MADHEAEDFGVRELAAAVRMAPSTVHRSLGALEEEGLIEPSAATGRYRLSLGFYRLALRGAARAPVLEQVLPHLRQAARSGGETALLSIFSTTQLEMIYVAEIPSRHALQVRLPLHQWLPLLGSAAGLAILCQLDAETLVSAVSQQPGRVESDQLAERLAEVRERGFAALSDSAAGVRELAVPFQGPGQTPLGALSFAVPESRANAVLESSLGQLLGQLAQAASKTLSNPTQPVLV